MARIFNYLDLNNLSDVKVGREIENVKYVAPKVAERPYTERHPAVLNTILVLLVAIIGAFIFAYVREMKR